MFAQHDRNIAHEWYICHYAANNVLALEVVLVVCVELVIVCWVVVSFREELCFISADTSVYESRA